MLPYHACTRGTTVLDAKALLLLFSSGDGSPVEERKTRQRGNAESESFESATKGHKISFRITWPLPGPKRTGPLIETINLNPMVGHPISSYLTMVKRPRAAPSNPSFEPIRRSTYLSIRIIRTQFPPSQNAIANGFNRNYFHCCRSGLMGSRSRIA